MTIYGIKSLRKVQLSREDVAQGTPTTDCTPWRGTGTIEDMRETVFPEEDIGIFGGVDRAYTPKEGGQLVLEGVATFEQLPHIFDAGIKNATATTDASSAFIRTYTFPEVSSDVVPSTDLMTYSFRAGDNKEVDKASFGFVSEFNITGTKSEALNISATFITREVENDTDGFTTDVIPTVYEIMFSKGKLYIDAIGGSIGGTQKSATLLDMDLKVTTGWMPVYTADGRLDFAFIKQVAPEITCDLTFEHEDSAVAEKAAARALTSRLLQLKFEGDALSDAIGGTYAVKTFIINLCGKWDAGSFRQLDEVDGNDVIKGTFRARYNATAEQFAQFIIANETETMPG